MAGSIFTGDVIKSQLEDANRNYYGQRTWAKLFGDLDLSKQLGTENLIRDYGLIMGEAYKASKANQSAILGSNVGQGYKNAMLEENQLALDKAYDSYMSQYLTEQSQLNQSIETQRQAINKELDTLAQRTADYGNAHFDYLQYLWDKHEADELNFNPFEKPQFAQYLIKGKDANGADTVTFDINKIRAGLFDENDTLNQQGIDFFDMIEHDSSLYKYSFADYLSETDKELYEWSRSENPYHFAPKQSGLNINDGMFREMVGQSSVDEQYSFIENAYGMKDGEIKNLFADLETKSAELIESLNYKGKLFMRDSYRLDDREINELSNEYISGLKKISSELGLSDGLSTIAKNAGYDTVDAYINDVILKYVETVAAGHGGQVFGYTADNHQLKTVDGAYKWTPTESKIDRYMATVDKAKLETANVFNSILSDLVNLAQSKND